MIRDRGRDRGRVLTALLAAVLLAPAALLAHERFVKHDLKNHLQDGFFMQEAGKPFGMDPNMIQVGLLVSLVLAAFFVCFFLRETLDGILRYKILAPLRGGIQRGVHTLACYVMDKPVRAGWFYSLGEWSVIMFLRSPALVLMYSATNDSLVMPSYPLEPTSAIYFKFLQVLLAILILTQTLLPLCGALIVGTWLYLFRWGPLVAIDALPVVTAGILYLMSPWQSHKLAITRLNAAQTRLIRIVFGLGFVVLGWSKIYNHDLTIGVADNYPWIMNDPMVGFFTMGTSPLFRRETWVLSFGLAEVMSGFMIMMGVFTRIWGTIMIVMFTKLTLVDFGWDEIPHIYPIGAALAVVTSNHLRSEFGLVERLERVLRGGTPVKRYALVAVSAAVIALLAVMPFLYLLTFTDRSYLK
jgi:uncharacterized membrane protein YphA (DoxX/SURF4 family)